MTLLNEARAVWDLEAVRRLQRPAAARHTRRGDRQLSGSTVSSAFRQTAGAPIGSRSSSSCWSDSEGGRCGLVVLRTASTFAAGDAGRHTGCITLGQVTHHGSSRFVAIDTVAPGRGGGRPFRTVLARSPLPPSTFHQKPLVKHRWPRKGLQATVRNGLPTPRPRSTVSVSTKRQEPW